MPDLHRLMVSNPGRRRVLEALLDGPAQSGTIAQRLHVSAATVSNHLAGLRAVGLVNSVVDGRWRTYSLREGVADLVRDEAQSGRV